MLCLRSRTSDDDDETSNTSTQNKKKSTPPLAKYTQHANEMDDQKVENRWSDEGIQRFYALTGHVNTDRLEDEGNGYAVEEKLLKDWQTEKENESKKPKKKRVRIEGVENFDKAKMEAWMKMSRGDTEAAKEYERVYGATRLTPV